MHFSTSLLAVVSLPLIAAGVVVPRQLATSSTENGLTGATGNTSCKAMTVIFARGTTEAGNVGTLSGPPFFANLSMIVGENNLAVQGVEYPANVQGFTAGGDANGSKLMAQLVGQAQTKCPNTKVVMSGYSQGGQLVHNAAKMLTAAQASNVNSVLIFGDPLNGTAVAQISPAKVKVVCHSGDNICQGGTQIKQAHLTYSQNGGEAAAFVANAAGMGKTNSTKAA
ncbi:cutinase-2 [Coleophoma crateriformis]|uniref:Cutinase n=1 Tax=Coleophoma crateriformis TaxID=565419 RepID=A0A3D8QUB4_9HELO|nr:cutinase-2 [Coleophoma crateriformis]